MKYNMSVIVVCALAASLMAGEEILQKGWRFQRGDCDNAAAVNFDDSAWEQVRVPHDWAISGPFNLKESGGSGKLPWKGVGWYRRTVKLGNLQGKSVFFDFGGVMARPQVYVNGHLAGGCNYGYASFRVDATPFVQEGDNVLAVQADTRHHFARWYPGAGIYRKVTLKVEDAAHFAYNSIFVQTPEVTDQAALVRVSWETEAAPSGSRVAVQVAPAGSEAQVARAETDAAVGALALTVKNPVRWDVDHPDLYVATVRLLDAAGQERAYERVRFGIRTITFPVPTEGPATNDWAANGFHLNGRRVQLKGVDLHSDLGLLGMAFDKSAMRRQLQLMKDMGANALRTSHNCPAPEVLDLCDEMGILVWDECFDQWGRLSGRLDTENLERFVGDNLQAFVKRDRNHPSVIVWSMYNEIGKGKDGDQNHPGLTKDRCSFFRSLMRLHDTTRPIGGGNIGYMSHKDALDMGIYDDFDITGWNYGAQYRPLKALYPHKPIIYSESASALSSYGYYSNPPPNDKHDYAKADFQVDSYDHNAGPDIPDVEFERMEKDVYVCGEFVWTGIDYLGEPTPYWQDCRSSFYGIADLCCVPKDRYWLYRSYWNPTAETIHLLPHWNWAGHEGKKVPVYVYTNGDSAELFVNGKSQGLRRKGTPARKPVVNLAQGGTATASSEEVDASKSNRAACALDGDDKTRWCAASSALPAWLQVEFPQPRSFQYVTVRFEQDLQHYAYELQLSDDGSTWRTVFSKKVDETTRPAFATPQTAKFLKVVVTGSKKGMWASVRDLVVSTDAYEPQNPYYDICDNYRLRWLDVVYEPGEVKAVAYKDGKKLGECVMRTAGEPVALKAVAERPLGKDPDELLWVQIDALDAQGVRNPLAMNRVNFRLEGPGTILGVGNGNAHEFEPFTKTDSHSMFFGKVVAVVRREGVGRLALTVSSEGLAPSTVELP